MNPCNPSARPSASKPSRRRVNVDRVAAARRSLTALGVRLVFTRNGRPVGEPEGLSVVGTSRDVCRMYPDLLRTVAGVLMRTADDLQTKHPRLCGKGDKASAPTRGGLKSSPLN